MREIADLALVTGAARRLGREIALALAEKGYNIGLHYNTSRNEAEETAQKIEKIGRKVIFCQADLQDPLQINTMFQQIKNSGIDLKVLINSAAIMPRQPVGEITVESWDEVMNTNLRAPMLCCQAAARLMPDGGVIINITDSGAGKAWVNYGAYTISKAGLEVLTSVCAKAFAPKIRVNAVAPGLILPSPYISSEEWDKLVQRVPARRAGSVSDIVQAVLFLIHNGYITGETIRVDGGYKLL
jgi:NAD(P)-dependent dehydrogenase (short-subunit alcohol dehydrogenase family)